MAREKSPLRGALKFSNEEEKEMKNQLKNERRLGEFP
jgi:hypothetical protein